MAEADLSQMGKLALGPAGCVLATPTEMRILSPGYQSLRTVCIGVRGDAKGDQFGPGSCCKIAFNSTGT